MQDPKFALGHIVRIARVQALLELFDMIDRFGHVCTSIALQMRLFDRHIHTFDHRLGLRIIERRKRTKKRRRIELLIK